MAKGSKSTGGPPSRSWPAGSALSTTRSSRPRGREAGRRGLPRGGAIVKRLSRLSEPDLSKVDSYERKHQSRKTIHDKIASLRD